MTGAGRPITSKPSDGARTCRRCGRSPRNMAAGCKAYPGRNKPPHEPGDWAVCPAGHQKTPENWRWRGKHPTCHACLRDRQGKAYQAKAAPVQDQKKLAEAILRGRAMQLRSQGLPRREVAFLCHVSETTVERWDHHLEANPSAGVAYAQALSLEDDRTNEELRKGLPHKPAGKGNMEQQMMAVGKELKMLLKELNMEEVKQIARQARRSGPTRNKQDGAP